jgi:hypothetical protein
MARLERLGKLKKNSMTSSGLEPAIFRLQHGASSIYATACRLVKMTKFINLCLHENDIVIEAE